jgi:hypothetical protein
MGNAGKQGRTRFIPENPLGPNPAVGAATSPRCAEFAPVAAVYHGDQYCYVFDLADEAPVAYAIFPELAQFATPQRLTDASGVVQGGKTFAQKAAQSLGDRIVQFGELIFGSLGNLYLPGQAVPPLPPGSGFAPCRCPDEARPVRRGRDLPYFPGIPEWLSGHKRSCCARHALPGSPARLRYLPANESLT